MSGLSEWVLPGDLACPTCSKLDQLEAKLAAQPADDPSLELCERHLRLCHQLGLRLTNESRCWLCRQLRTEARGVVASSDPHRLCFRHLILLRDIDPGRYARAVAERSRWLAERLVLLKEYFRKEDYRFRNEPRGREQTAYLEVLAFLAGPPPETGPVRADNAAEGPVSFDPSGYTSHDVDP